jgi:hypothetical protein
MRRRHGPVAKERNAGCRYEDAPAHMHRQPIKYFNYLLDDLSWKGRLEDVPQRLQLARVVCIGPCEMTNREAILRLSVDTGDGLAITWLHENNIDVIRGAVARYFGAGLAADKAERLLMQRVANHARTYEQQENPEEWLARCANLECDRLRNEAIHDKANSG